MLSGHFNKLLQIILIIRKSLRITFGIGRLLVIVSELDKQEILLLQIRVDLLQSSLIDKGPGTPPIDRKTAQHHFILQIEQQSLRQSHLRVCSNLIKRNRTVSGIDDTCHILLLTVLQL